MAGALLVTLALCAALLGVADAARADDATPAEVTSFSITPSHVDTGSADQVVTITATLADPQSGVSSASWDLRPSVGTQGLTGMLGRISGDSSNGVYRAVVTMPKGSQNGAWTASIHVRDNVGNDVTLHASDLEALFGAGCAQVTNDATTFDSTAPQVTAFSIAPSHVNTESAAQTVTVSATLSDDPSGVSNAQVAFAAPTGSQEVWTNLKRTSGDALSGTYAGTVTMPKGSTEGAWKAHVVLVDKLGNSVWLYASSLEALFGSGSAQVVNEATASDSTPPAITAFSVTPTEVDSGSAIQPLTVTVTLTDDLSGVSCADVGFRPLIGTQELAGVGLERVSGDAWNGVYATTLYMLKGAKEGLWVPSLWMLDKLGNRVSLDADELNALLPNAEGLTVANTATAQQVTIDRDWTLTAAQSSVTFPAGTVVTRADDGRFAFYQMTAQAFTLDDSIPTTDLDDVPVATLRFGIPGLNLTFSQPVKVSMAVGSQYDGYRLNIQSLTEGGTAWANETAVDVADGSCCFTVSHATRFAATRAKPMVTRLSAAKVRRGSRIAISGKGLGAKRGAVRFGAKTATRYISWSANRIVCRVPTKARLGRLKVTVVTAVGASNAKTLRVTR